jgi:hypothetical protein
VQTGVSCADARAEHRRLRRLVARARRDARRAKARVTAAGKPRAQLRRIHRAKQRKLRRLEARLDRALRLVRARC